MGTITIIGAGWTEGQLTMQAAEALRSAGRVVLHTSRCGCADWLDRMGIAYETLDALYDAFEDFDAHADAAAQAVQDAAAESDVAYVVFDVRDRSVARLVSRLADAPRVIAGPPAEGPLLPLETGEARCVEASDWEDFHLTARENCFIRELDSRELACEVKLRLMEVYPEESDIWIARGDEPPVRVPLYELDRFDGFDHRTCVLVPAERDVLKLERFDYGHLDEIIRVLCAPDGCPWDRVQTHESLRPYILEEAYEVIDAIDEGSPEHLYDELGDVLLQVALHAEIGRRHGEFDASDVTTAICEKMIHRHTHVFGRDRADDAEQVLDLWSRNKMAERGQKTRVEAMRDITRSLPATLRAAKVFKRAAEAGLRPADAGETLNDTRRRVEALAAANDVEAAMGDALLALCACARQFGVDPEIALNAASDRFIARFAEIESKLLAEGENFESLSPETLRKYWELVKL